MTVPLIALWIAAPFPLAPVQTPAELSIEIQAIAKADQDDRKDSNFFLAHMKEIGMRDRARLARCRYIVQLDRVFTANDLDALALVFQHGDDPDNYVVARELGIMAFAKGKYGSLPALAEDRFLVHVGKTQRFGSQFGWGNDGKPVWNGLDEDSETALTDTFRLDFLQPGIEDIKKRGLQAFQSMNDAVVARLMESVDPKWQNEKESERESLDLWTWFRRTRKQRFSEEDRKKMITLFRRDRLRASRDAFIAATVLASSNNEGRLLLANELAAYGSCRNYGPAKTVFLRTWDGLLKLWKRPARYGTVKSTGFLASKCVHRFFGEVQEVSPPR